MRRSVVLALLAWVSVVAAGSGVTWTVINAAGQQVLSTSPAVVPPTAPTSDQPRPHTPAVGPPQEPRHHPRRSVQAAESAEPSSPPRQEDEAPPPSYAQRAWQGTGGTVVVRCSDGRASLEAASPDDGYAVRVESRGPWEVEVKFGSTKTTREIEVKAVCSARVPRFSTESSPSEGDGESRG